MKSFALILIMCVAGCGTDASPEPALIQSAFSTDSPRLELAEELRLEIDGQERMNGPQFIAVDSSGSFFLVHNGQLKAFAADGRELWTVGEADPSSRQFATVRGIEMYEDTLILMDYGLGYPRLQMFDTNGTSLGERAFAGGQITTENGIIGFGQAPSGFAIVTRRYATDEHPNASGFREVGRVDELRIYRSLRDSGRVAARWETRGTGVGAELGGSPVEVYPVFGNSEKYAMSPAGIYRSDPASYTIRMLDTLGVSYDSIAVQVEQRPVTSEMKLADLQTSVREWELSVAQGTSDSAALTEWRTNIMPVIESRPSPEHRPVVGQMRAAPDGTLAVERLDVHEVHSSIDDSTVVDILDAQGSRRGHVVLPPYTKLVRNLGTHLIAVQADRREGIPAKHAVLRYLIQ